MVKLAFYWAALFVLFLIDLLNSSSPQRFFRTALMMLFFSSILSTIPHYKLSNLFTVYFILHSWLTTRTFDVTTTNGYTAIIVITKLHTTNLFELLHLICRWLIHHVSKTQQVLTQLSSLLESTIRTPITIRYNFVCFYLRHLSSRTVNMR